MQPTHIITAGFSIAMVIVAIAGIHQNKKKVIAGLGWDAWVMSFLFLLGSSILFYLR